LLLEQAQQILHLKAFPFLAGNIEHHLALMQHDGTVAHVQSLFHAVGHHYCGQFLLGDDVLGQFQNKGGGFRVQGGGMLVQQQHA